MSRILHRVAELCFELEQAQSLAVVREAMRQAAGLFGASFYFVSMRTGKTISPPVQLVLTTYPKRFQRYFDQHGAIEYDPVVQHALKMTGAFRWDGLYQTERDLALHRECIECGMEFGFSVADRGPDGATLLMCFCGARPIVPGPAVWEQAAAAAVMFGAAAHRALARMARRRHERSKAKPPQLSTAELRALQMTATAMTAEQVARVMGVRPGTVRYYLDRAAAKLGAGSRKEAVAKAIAQGIVDTRIFPITGFSESAEDFES
jgi:LuxR family transcriptional activator of conjugal transfer of Ti plasmids